MTNPGRFCEHCGAALRASARFCESCGQPVGGGGGTPAPSAPAPSVLTCDACRTADQVVAASAYTAASDSKQPGDDRIDPDGVEIFLEKPEQPEAPTLVGWVLAAFIPLVLFFVYWFAPIHRGFKYLLFGFTVMFVASIFVAPIYATGIYPIVGLLHLLLYWGALFLGRDRSKVELVTTHIPAYRARLARWEHLQYCKRCQRVWLDNASVPPVKLVDVETLLAR